MRSKHHMGTLTGANIRAARLRLGWSQTELAGKLAVSQPTVAHWESGAHAPRWALLPRITALLDMRRDELMPENEFPAGIDQSKTPIRNIPVFEWPRSECDVNLLVSGKAMPVSYVSLVSPGAAPVAIIMDDPAATDEFPPGSIGLLDLTDRAPKDGSWYLFVVDGAPVTRIWRSESTTHKSPVNGARWNAAASFANRNGPVGRIVLSIRPH